MTHRLPRINSLIRQEISGLLSQEVKDPRLGNYISITEVDTSGDLRQTRIYVSFIGNDNEKQAALTALNAASGYFHSVLMKRLRLRHVPEISFYWDDSIARGAHLQALIDEVNTDNSETESAKPDDY
jgi:ribosome-binding factor A